MTLTEIKEAIAEGKQVFWSSSYYEVIRDSIGQFLIYSRCNNSYIGLTWQDGVTLNGSEDNFYIKGERRA